MRKGSIAEMVTDLRTKIAALDAVDARRKKAATRIGVVDKDIHVRVTLAEIAYQEAAVALALAARDALPRLIAVTEAAQAYADMRQACIEGEYDDKHLNERGKEWTRIENALVRTILAPTRSTTTKQIRLKPPTTRPVRLAPSKTRRLDPRKVADALGAEDVGPAPRQPGGRR